MSSSSERRPARRRGLGPVVAAITAVLLTACTDGSGYDVGTGTGPLPEASFAVLGDASTTVSTTDWRGTPTVVNFWATWCEFCTEEMPDIEEVSRELDGRVRFVGIDRQDPVDAALEFVAETGVTYDQLSSPDGRYYLQLGNRGMPTTLFVDADGVVTYRHTGPMDADLLRELVAEHLGVQA